MKANKIKKSTGIVLAVAMCVTAAIPSYAATVSVNVDCGAITVTSELEDNILEYNEIDALIHAYNTQVLENAYNLNKYSQPDEESVEDKETTRIGYQSEEMSLCQQAKELMIAYYDGIMNEESAGLNVQLLSSQLQVTKTRASIGSATQIDVLTAQENLLNAMKTQTEATASVAESRKTLQVMCGWKYESEAELATLPEPDFARIDAIDVAGDVNKAIENNFTIRANKRRMRNCDDTADKNTYKATIASNEQNVTNSVNTAYANIIAARDTYNAAVTAAQVEEKNLQTVTIKYSTGAASQLELQTQTYNTRLAQIAAEQAKHNVLKLMTEYDYAVAGLANA